MTGPRPRPGLERLQAYAAPQLDAPVRLNTNECPYPLPEPFVRDLARALAAISLNRYPDREAAVLRGGLAERTGHPVEGIWVANGSNEIIQQLLLAYGGPGRRAFLFEPTYVLHETIASITETRTLSVSLDPPYTITPDDMGAARTASPDVLFVCSPNNPTGDARPPELVEDLASNRDTLVIVDEAYIEFGGKSAAPLVASHPNVAVVRTFSKAFALAGARLGYCLASAEVVEQLHRVRLPYHVSALTQAAGVTALAYADEAMAILDAVRRERDRILEGLTSIEGLTIFPSDANFVLFHPGRPARVVWKGLLDRGVLVRDVSGLVPGCLRVTAGTPEEVDAFLEALAEVVS